jgi:hypothetical protein
MEDVKVLKDLAVVLRPISAVSTMLEGESYQTISIVSVTMLALCKVQPSPAHDARVQKVQSEFSTRLEALWVSLLFVFYCPSFRLQIKESTAHAAVMSAGTLDGRFKAMPLIKLNGPDILLADFQKGLAREVSTLMFACA